MNKPLISYLLLDFLRPNESKACIESIYKYTKFPFEIIYLSNGGGLENQEYVLDYYKKGLIHKLILRKENGGLGIGTTDIFRYCDTEFSLYLQTDQFIRRTFAQDELEYIISFFDTTKNGKIVKSVSLAGDNAGNSQYSERGHIIRTKFYNDIPGKTIYGAGPYHDGEWNESVIQRYYKENNYLHLIYDIIVQDNGCWAVRQNPDGTIIRHRTDTKETFFESTPKQKYIHPPLTDSEWSLALEGKWINGTIPENLKQHSFKFWK